MSYRISQLARLIKHYKLRVVLFLLMSMLSSFTSTAYANPAPIQELPIEIGIILPSVSYVEPLPALLYTPLEPVTMLKPKRVEGGLNTYAAGNCTFFVKSRIPSLPSNLGDANTWADRAAAQGWEVSSIPQVGAVAATTSMSYWGHVAIVTRVYGSKIEVIEMNVKGLGVVSTGVYDASLFRFIYI